MYAGHFAPVPVLQKYYPKVSPFVLTFGVCFLDLAFGVLSYIGVEGFSKNPHAGDLGVNLHCDYSHSLVGSIILSLLYGTVTGSLVPGFLSSFSHFIADWLVHNQDLPLDPFSKIIVGGTNMWGKYPNFAFYFEMAFCIVFALFASKDQTTLIANGFILFVHVSGRSITPQVVGKIMTLSDALRQRYIALTMFLSFGIPAIILAFILRSRQNVHNKKK